ncbi:MAG: dTDP-4-dehydrorhamnose reductase [Acutalibacteraceae bacterium]
MIVVTGAKGQLGSDVCENLKSRGLPYEGIDIDTLDLTDENATENYFKSKSISALIHCAAYTAVDKAEDEKELCFKVNAKATEILAKECEKADIKMLYVSTDYVFPGNGDTPFNVESETSPLNVYGQSKLLGEQAVRKHCKKHFIVRTSWVFGEKNTNFIATMLRLSESKSELNVVNDQIGSPTYAKDLARLICDMIVTEKYGTYHGTNEGCCSWYDLAKKTFELAGRTVNVTPVTSDCFPAKAKRPLNSRLNKDCLDEAGFKRLPLWEDAVERYLKNIL